MILGWCKCNILLDEYEWTKYSIDYAVQSDSIAFCVFICDWEPLQQSDLYLRQIYVIKEIFCFTYFNSQCLLSSHLESSKIIWTPFIAFIYLQQRLLFTSHSMQNSFEVLFKFWYNFFSHLSWIVSTEGLFLKVSI